MLRIFNIHFLFDLDWLINFFSIFAVFHFISIHFQSRKFFRVFPMKWNEKNIYRSRVVVVVVVAVVHISGWGKSMNRQISQFFLCFLRHSDQWPINRSMLDEKKKEKFTTQALASKKKKQIQSFRNKKKFFFFIIFVFQFSIVRKFFLVLVSLCFFFVLITITKEEEKEKKD